MSSKPQPDASNGDNAKGDSSKGDSSKGNSESRQSLPFEPTKSRKQAAKTPKSSPASSSPKASAPKESAKVSASPVKRSTAQDAAIPDAVTKRMVKRMAILCGIPTVLGMLTFVVSYLLRINDVFQVPTYAVLLVSLGWFGLGVVGLSYGVLSASWDEDNPGSLAGFSEFAINWGRMTEAWRSSKNKS